MKRKWIGIVCVAACLETFFILVLLKTAWSVSWNTFEDAEKRVLYLLTLQNGVWAVMLTVGAFFLIWSAWRKSTASPFQSLLVFTNAGEQKEAFSLRNGRTLFITKPSKEELQIKGSKTGFSDTGCATLRLVSGSWYLEVLTERHPMGLRRGEEAVVYRLKPYLPYKLVVNDIIYIDSKKLVIQ